MQNCRPKVHHNQLYDAQIGRKAQRRSLGRRRYADRLFTGKLPLADQDPNVIDAELRKRARLFSARHLVNLHKHIALRALPDTAVRPAIASSASLSKLSGTIVVTLMTMT